jgi:hypothetical protein
LAVAERGLVDGTLRYGGYPMTVTAVDALSLWTDVLANPEEERRAALRAVLAADVVSVTPLGRAEGAEAVSAGLGQSPLSGLFASGTWGEVADQGGSASVTCTFGPGAPLGGVTITATTAGGQLSKVETTMIPAPPPEPVPVDLSGDIASAINGALANGTPVIVAYVDSDGQPQLSLRGTAQVLNEKQLAMWSRSATGGLPTSVADRPPITAFYRDPAKRVTYQLQGRARVEPDESLRRQIFDHSPEVEQNFDPELKGAAIVVDVTRVEGRDQRGAFVMSASAG